MHKNKKAKHQDDKLIDFLLELVFPSVGRKGDKKNSFGCLESIILGNSRIKDENKFDGGNGAEKTRAKPQVHDFFSGKKPGISQDAKLEAVIKSAMEGGNLIYTAELSRKKESDEPPGYSLRIKYEDNGSDERLDIEFVPTGYGLMRLNYGNAGDKNESMNHAAYSISIISKRDGPEKNKNNNAKNNYSIKVVYEDDYNEERLSVSYRRQVDGYLQRHIESREDFTERVPLKFLNILPETMMGGVLGFTYIGDHSMGRRADLTGGTARMVDIHESIHTPDEYETRCITQWIMSKEKSKYIK